MPKARKEDTKTVVVALLANLVIAAAKYAAAFVTGSSGMLSEAIHSTADTGNELLLFLGIRRSSKPPDDDHPFGHGREVYFWSLIVAIMLFSAGAGSAVYEGITHLSRHEQYQASIWNYVVLGVAAVAEIYSWMVAYRHLRNEQAPGESFWHTLQSSKDPATLVVFGENSADVAGIAAALLGLVFSELLHSHIPDVIASIAIGLILAAVAIYLTVQSKSLLIGERADRGLIESVQRIVQGHEGVAQARPPLTMHMGPGDVLLCLDVEFKPHIPAGELVDLVDDIERQIHREHPSVGRIFIETERLKMQQDNQASRIEP